MSYLASQYERVLVFCKSISQSPLRVKDVASVASDHGHGVLVANILGSIEGLPIEFQGSREIALLSVNHADVSKFPSCGFLVASLPRERQRLFIQCFCFFEIALVDRNFGHRMQSLRLASQVSGIVENPPALFAIGGCRLEFPEISQSPTLRYFRPSQQESGAQCRSFSDCQV